jgi:purine-binding chemotaxis protein CheW
LPLSDVVDIMRPLPVIPIAGAPSAVLGMCVMRGVATPVIDAAQCVLGQPGTPTRFVALRAGERRIALAVDAVPGTLELPEARTTQLPQLLASASEAIVATAALDAQFFLLLSAGRVLPQGEHWKDLGRTSHAEHD